MNRPFILLLCIISFGIGISVADHYNRTEVEAVSKFLDKQKLAWTQANAKQANLILANRKDEIAKGKWEFSGSQLGIGIRER